MTPTLPATGKSFGSFSERFPHNRADTKDAASPFPRDPSNNCSHLRTVAGAEPRESQRNKVRVQTFLLLDFLLHKEILFLTGGARPGWSFCPLYPKTPHLIHCLRMLLHIGPSTHVLSPVWQLQIFTCGYSKLTSDLILSSRNPEWAEEKSRQRYAQLDKGNAYCWFPSHG